MLLPLFLISSHYGVEMPTGYGGLLYIVEFAQCKGEICWWWSWNWWSKAWWNGSGIVSEMWITIFQKMQIGHCFLEIKCTLTELLEAKRVMAFFYRWYYLFYYTRLFTRRTPVEDLYNQNHDSRDGEIYTLASENKQYFGTCIKVINQLSQEIAYLEVGSVLCSEIMIWLDVWYMVVL